MLQPSDVMEWKKNLFNTDLIWKIEPSIDVVTSLMQYKIQHVSKKNKRYDNDAPKATFFAGGAFNKLYLMDYPGSSWILRASLPVDPYYKIASEVATLRLVESSTSLPVPQVDAFFDGKTDATSGDDCLGLEWILMKRLPGKTLKDAWSETSLEQKMLVVDSLADKIYELYSCQGSRFSCIGNVYQTSGRTGIVESRMSIRSPPYTVGRIVSMPFFWEQRVSQPVERGPLLSSAEWFASRLQLVDYECSQIINSADADEDDKEDAERYKAIAERLTKHIKSFIPAQERFVLHHDDINTANVLVDLSTSALTGIVDWECVSVIPTWASRQPPRFLSIAKKYLRYKKPCVERYGKDDDGSITVLYFEHLRQWELTLLRERFLDRMSSHKDSDWMDIYNSSAKIRDFDTAVNYCNDCLMAHRIEKWLSILESGGQYRRLFECLDHDLIDMQM
ncbi:hypothetical protein TWF694_001407 [Orbilia ellipsospora]|uniref:Aminoglycoside phosphotransferase domain-containing protein n=1 Tax=Orbilia ellipsospora TaxID=2528407 RepID=A0AAV9XSZ6_9PEZI